MCLNMGTPAMNAHRVAVYALLLFIAHAFSAPTVAAGATPESCAEITSDQARLTCYDDIFGVTRGESVPTKSKWTKRVETSQMADETDVFLTLLSDDRVAGRFGNDGSGVLYIRCMENTTALQFRVGDHFLADIQGYGRVEYRLDDRPMQSKNFRESTSNETLGLWNGGQSIPFMKSMLGHDRMIVRITPFNESPKTMTFSIAGLDTEIEQLRKTCGW